MDESGMTNEFSICLMLDPNAKQTIEAIRQSLPAPPLRDDSPHITLLRTIKCPSRMSDKDLLRDMERLLELTKNLPLSATVHKTANLFSPLFGVSSTVQLHASPELKNYHKQVKKILMANNYSVGVFARLVFMPHISVRLGVPYTKQAKEVAEKSFPTGAKLTFTTWAIFRDIKRDGKYLVKEIVLGS
jgi:hypothetical protein